MKKRSMGLAASLCALSCAAFFAVTPGSLAHPLFTSTANAAETPTLLLTDTALLKHGVESTRYVLTGAKHGDLSAMLGDPEAALPWSTEETLGYITRFLTQHVNSR